MKNQKYDESESLNPRYLPEDKQKSGININADLIVIIAGAAVAAAIWTVINGPGGPIVGALIGGVSAFVGIRL